MAYGRETITIFEIDQPMCALRYGDGVPAFSVDGADFDGSNDYMRRVAGLTGAADSKSGILSVWLRFDGGTFMTIFSGATTLAGGSVRLQLTRENGGQLKLNVLDSPGVTGVAIILTNSGVGNGGGWEHYLFAWNAATGVIQVYTNDASDLHVSSSTANATADYTLADWAIGAIPDGTTKFNGCIAEFYFAPGQYLDLSVAENRRKFISSTARPVNLGADGSTPTGTAPLVYLHLDSDEAVADLATNRATGGNFSITGTLTTADSDPSALSSGCLAVLGVTGTRKCYNTRATCQDTTNYTPGGSPDPTLTLRFARPQEGLLQYGTVYPSIIDISTTPAALNLAAMDESSSALGIREVIRVQLSDHLHSDHQVDLYRLERNVASGSPPAETFDPALRGTFWGKWLARNPYHSNYNCRVREGFLGDALADMRVRNYIIERIEGPDDGTVTLTAKDMFSRIEARKSVAPTASRGELLADITAAATSATLTPTGIGDLDYPYMTGSPSRLYVAIGKEIIQCTRAGDVLTLVTRGAFGTTAETHKTEDLVQWVLIYTSQLAHDIVYDLLVNYSVIEAADIPYADWAVQAAELTALYTACIAEPTPITDLIGELSEQAGFTLLPDVGTGQVNMVALRASSPTVTVNDDEWIVDKSLSLKRDDAKRASQVWVYYAQVNPLESLDDPKNYRSRLVTIDTDAESDNEYGAPAIRTIFSRWIPPFGRSFASDVGDRVLAIFRNAPLEAEFRIHASRDGEINPAELFALQVAEVQDDTGAEQAVTLAAIEIERGENEITIKGQQVAFFSSSADQNVERVIYIENDWQNLSLRDRHDLLYAAPVGGSPGEQIRFVIIAGVTVGSASSTSYALDTGTWPSGVTLSLDIEGRVEGKGGAGGAGGSGFGPTAGVAGGQGGPAIRAQYPISIDNLSGEIWAGGGGGGGGGGSSQGFNRDGGGGGGGGAGTDAGAVGAGGTGIFTNGPAGTVGSAETAGTGGATFWAGGDGGAGGGPGLAGTAGQAAAIGGATNGAGGAAGATNDYITGNAFVTWVNNGDRRGNVS